MRINVKNRFVIDDTVDADTEKHENNKNNNLENEETFFESFLNVTNNKRILNEPALIKISDYSLIESQKCELFDLVRSFLLSFEGIDDVNGLAGCRYLLVTVLVQDSNDWYF